MYYTPKYKTQEELLTQRGFSPAETNRGWVKYLGRKKGIRLHALVNAGEMGRLNLHRDEDSKNKEGKKVHVTLQQSSRVIDEIKEIKKLDVPTGLFRRFVHRLLYSS